LVETLFHQNGLSRISETSSQTCAQWTAQHQLRIDTLRYAQLVLHAPTPRRPCRRDSEERGPPRTLRHKVCDSADAVRGGEGQCIPATKAFHDGIVKLTLDWAKIG
jgi:hypothetical protein